MKFLKIFIIIIYLLLIPGLLFIGYLLGFNIEQILFNSFCIMFISGILLILLFIFVLN